MTAHDPSPEPAGTPELVDAAPADVGEGRPPTAVVHEKGVTRAGAAWVATGGGLVLLILLLVFILQNQAKVELQFLMFDGRFPAGVAMLIAAVVGGVLVGVSGTARVLQLRRDLRRVKRRTEA